MRRQTTIAARTPIRTRVLARSRPNPRLWRLTLQFFLLLARNRSFQSLRSEYALTVESGFGRFIEMGIQPEEIAG